MSRDSANRFQSHEALCDADRERLYLFAERNRLAIESMKEILDSKVDWKQFWIIVSILITVLTGLFGYITVQLKELSQTTNKVENSVSYMTGVFKTNDIEVQK